ncbi:hypothetical protein MKX01_023091, partial [Papaver californicum]
EEITKLEYERKTSLLQKQETGDHDLLRTEEARAKIESLESNLSYLRHSIGKTCLTLLISGTKSYTLSYSNYLLATEEATEDIPGEAVCRICLPKTEGWKRN